MQGLWFKLLVAHKPFAARMISSFLFIYFIYTDYKGSIWLPSYLFIYFLSWSLFSFGLLDIWSFSFFDKKHKF